MSEDIAEYKVDRKVKPKQNPAKKKTKKQQKPANIHEKQQGRPSKYKPEYNKIAFEAARKGLNDEQIAELFSVTFQTLNNWKHDHEGFFESLQKGKDDHDVGIVESSLLKRVKGYEYQEIYSELDVNGKPIPEKTRVVKKYMGPDTRAIMFWLTNRNNKRWSANPAPQGEGTAKLISEFINALRPKIEIEQEQETETDET